MDQARALADRTNGRWTKQEHQNFMLGLRMHGKNWRKIEQMVVTRNGSQIRSHAQKYFMKLSHKLSQQDSTVQNKDPDKALTKQKEITTKSFNKKYKIPCLNSAFFWQQIYQLLQISNFNFWDYVQIGQSNNEAKPKQKSFVPLQQGHKQPLKQVILNNENNSLALNKE